MGSLLPFTVGYTLMGRQVSNVPTILMVIVCFAALVILIVKTFKQKHESHKN